MCLLTEKEAADRGRVSAETIRRLVDAGRLEWANFAVKPGKRLIRIPCEALARTLATTTPDVQPQRRRRRRVSAEPFQVW